MAQRGEFVNRKGIYPPLPDADKIQFVQMVKLNTKEFAEKKKVQADIFALAGQFNITDSRRSVESALPAKELVRPDRITHHIYLFRRPITAMCMLETNSWYLDRTKPGEFLSLLTWPLCCTDYLIITVKARFFA